MIIQLPVKLGQATRTWISLESWVVPVEDMAVLFPTAWLTCTKEKGLN